MSRKRRFTSVAFAGITFQAGSAAVDSATIMSALVFQLTGSPVLVGPCLRSCALAGCRHN
jgi:hypothetical protein